MNDHEWIKRPLEEAYVQGIIDKIARTLDKYELVIPEVDDVIREIVATKPEDYFGVVVVISQTLIKYESVSPFMTELVAGVRQDFWHGINEDFEKHEGEYYVTSVTD
jgi:hypothetical protein